jgi:hypothetical protein
LFTKKPAPEMVAGFFVLILWKAGVGLYGFLRCSTSRLSHLGQISILSGITPVSTVNGGKHSPQKIGKAFLASHQACGGFLAFYTNGCGFLFHGFPS